AALRRVLISAERFKDAAMRCGSFQVNTPGSRSSALLCRITSADHRLGARLAADFAGFFFLAGIGALRWEAGLAAKRNAPRACSRPLPRHALAQPQSARTPAAFWLGHGGSGGRPRTARTGANERRWIGHAPRLPSAVTCSRTG